MNFTEYLTIKAYSKSTIRNYKEASAIFLKWCVNENITDETEVSHNDIIAYVKSCTDRGISQKTAAHYISSIKQYYDYLIHEGQLTANPCSYIKIKGIKRKILYDILPHETLEILYHSYKTEAANDYQTLIKRRNKAMLGLLVYQGLQSEELIRLEVQDLQLREGKIIIHGGRRSATRTMKLEAQQVFELMDYLNDTRKGLLQQSGKTPQGTTALFISPRTGKNIDSNTTYQLTREIRSINSKATSLNQIRASVIVHWLRLYNLRKVQHLAGHKYISSTEAYQSNNLEDLKEDIGKYHPF